MRAAWDCASSSSFPATKLKKRAKSSTLASVAFSSSTVASMASSVFYKFKSQKDESRVTFDGTGISVFDLKKEIILANNLGKANDFDLAVYDRSSNEGTLST